MAGSRKIVKSQKVKQAEMKINAYEILDGNDGNPNSPLEHENARGYENEMFFKADNDADDDAKKRILILNFIHRKVKHVTERKVPVLDRENDSRDIEVYHRETFQGVELDVCVYWPPRAKGDYKSCVAMVKFTSEDPSAENAVNGRIETDAAWNADVKTDAFTLKNDKLLGNYWAPRWKYVVNALKHTAYFRYEKNGDQKPPEPTLIAEAEDARGNESQEEREEKMSVFMGSTGKIIGPKGAKINEIKLASGVKDVKMPPKRDEGEPRPKARSLVEVTIIGKPRTIAKARELIQRVVDEWANAPRGGSTSFQASQNDFTNGVDDTVNDFGGDGTTGGGGEWDIDGAKDGISGDWDGAGQTTGGDNW